MNQEWLGWLVFGLAVVALGVTHYWGLKRRAAGMKKFAEEHGLSYSDWSPTPSSFPHEGNELKNAISGTLNGHKVFIVDEHVSAYKSSHIRTVVGFKNYSPAYREWSDAFRLWQVYPGDGWIWVYRRWWYVPEKSMARFVEKAWQKASARLS